jgi:DNA-binding HxlR family transcriptional regulator
MRPLRGKWNMRILSVPAAKTSQYSEIQRATLEANKKMLIDGLHLLEAYG